MNKFIGDERNDKRRKLKEIRIDMIDVGQRLGDFDEMNVLALVASIRGTGLKAPIYVRNKSPEEEAAERALPDFNFMKYRPYMLVVGLHRVLAMQRLYAKGEFVKELASGTITAFVEPTSNVRVNSEIEIDENLVRRELGPDERARLTTARKNVFKQETRCKREAKAKLDGIYEAVVKAAGAKSEAAHQVADLIEEVKDKDSAWVGNAALRAEEIASSVNAGAPVVYPGKQQPANVINPTSNRSIAGKMGVSPAKLTIDAQWEAVPAETKAKLRERGANKDVRRAVASMVAGGMGGDEAIAEYERKTQEAVREALAGAGAIAGRIEDRMDRAREQSAGLLDDLRDQIVRLGRNDLRELASLVRFQLGAPSTREEFAAALGATADIELVWATYNGDLEAARKVVALIKSPK